MNSQKFSQPLLGVFVSLLCSSQQALAALPLVVVPSTSPAATNWIDVFKGFFKDGGIAIGLILAVRALIWPGVSI